MVKPTSTMTPRLFFLVLLLVSTRIASAQANEPMRIAKTCWNQCDPDAGEYDEDVHAGFCMVYCPPKKPPPDAGCVCAQPKEVKCEEYDIGEL